MTAALLLCCHPLVLLVTRYETSRLDRIVRQTVKSNGQESGRNPLPDVFSYIFVVLVFLASVLTSLFTRFAIWPGIHYRIREGQDIEMVEYKPYQPASAMMAVSEATVV